jgi:xylulose-5-phosphate/fructose-6-phosphate phosphoketolase
MAAEVTECQNPSPLSSNIPEDVLLLSERCRDVRLDSTLRKHLQDFRNAANYIAAAMIFLQDNCLLVRQLKSEDIKPRLLGTVSNFSPIECNSSSLLLGHWGTCPGLVLVYAHLNLVIKKYDLDMILVVGPGHGAPAVLACLWLEGSLEWLYPSYRRDTVGLQNLITSFSRPGGFPRFVAVTNLSVLF